MASLGICLVIVYFSSVVGADESPIELTANERSTLSQIGKDDHRILNLHALTDSDPGTAIEIPFDQTGDSHLVLTFDLGSEAFRVDSAVFDIEPTHRGHDAGNVEFFCYSTRDGFTSLRLAKLERTTRPQTFRMHGKNTRCFIVRIDAPLTGGKLRIRKLSLWGRIEAEPLHIIRQAALKQLDSVSQLGLETSNDEKRMLHDAADGHFDEFSLAEAALIASGVVNQRDRLPYLARIEKLEVIARQRIASQPGADLKALALLRLLHSTAMRNGYREGQYRLDTLLNRGTYNCLSSTILFNHLADRLGMDFRAISLSDHVFSILYRGHVHVDFETTTARPGIDCGFQIGRDASRDWEQRREIRGPGLVAGIYAWREKESLQARSAGDALLTVLKVSVLDPSVDEAANLIPARFRAWIVDLARRADFERCLQAADLSIAVTNVEQSDDFTKLRQMVLNHWLASELDHSRFRNAFELIVRHMDESAALKRNLGYVIQEWVWSVYEQAGDEKADALLVQLTNEHPKLSEIKDRATHFYQRRALRAVDNGNMEVAMKVIDRFVEFVGSGPQSIKLTHLVCDRRATHCINAQNWPAAWEAYEMGIKRLPNDSHLQHNAIVTIQQWADVCRKQGNWQGVTQAYDRILARFPQNERLRREASRAWEAWGAVLVEAGQKAQAADVYRKALHRFPAEPSFRAKLRYLMQILEK